MGLTRILDSSLLIAAYDEMDPRRHAARQALANPEPAVIPPEVLCETLGVVQRRRSAESARSLWGLIRQLPQVRIGERTDPGPIGVLFESGLRKLSWVDCAVVCWSRKLEAKVECFDPELEAATRPGAV